MNSVTEYSQPIFTPSELEIIKLICEQYFDDEIAKKLSLRLRTVKKIQKSIKSKMKVKNTVGLVVYAVTHDIFYVERMTE